MLLPGRTGAAPAAPLAVPAGAVLTRVWARAAAAPNEIWVLGGLTFLAAAVRFATIASQSYWVDEATTVHEMQLSFGALLHAVRVDETTPPLYFVLAWVWAKLFGIGEAGLRSMSAVLGTALIPILYLCGRDLVSRRAGAVAGALAALSPFMIWYSQEARSYMLLGVLCGASFLFCTRAWRSPSKLNLALWATFSALAILTHFFAGFLVAPEAIWLLCGARNRAAVTAIAAVTLVQLAILPLALSDTSHPLGWIQAFPLASRIQQVPVDLGLGTLYQSAIVTYGLLGAAVLSGVVIVLLVVGAESEWLRRAGIAAAVGGAVILVPLVLAVLGSDYYVPRNLLPAWIPLAVLIGAACAVPRPRWAGGALAALLLGAFIYAGIRIDGNPRYQRPDWRGVAAALGHAPGQRAIVAYDGGFAAGPLAIYLPRVPWSQGSGATVDVGEVDVIGSTAQKRADPLPPGTRLISSQAVDSYLVQRFSVSPAWHLTPAALGARAGALLGPAPPRPAVLIQRPPAIGFVAPMRRPPA